jgi:hypothetical protein
MKKHGEVEAHVHAFLTSALGGSEWSVSSSGRFTFEKGGSCTHSVGGWVGPRAGLDAMTKGKTLNLPGIEPRSSILQPSLKSS